MADLLFLCQIHLFAVAKSVTICYNFNLCGRQPVICVAGAVLAFLWRGRLLLSEAAVTDCLPGRRSLLQCPGDVCFRMKCQSRALVPPCILNGLYGGVF